MGRCSLMCFSCSHMTTLLIEVCWLVSLPIMDWPEVLNTVVLSRSACAYSDKSDDTFNVRNSHGKEDA